MRGHPKNDTGHSDDLGILLLAALELDRTWMERGACRRWRYDDDPEGEILRPSPWHVSATATVIIAGSPVSGRELVKLALLWCHGCPAQWDCARYAVQGLCQAGTWSMRITALKALQGDIPAALELIEEAEASGTPVQVAVRAVVDASR